jgi:hypothetical protein
LIINCSEKWGQSIQAAAYNAVHMANQSNPFTFTLCLNKSRGSMPCVHSRVRVGNSFTWVGAGLSGVKLLVWSFKMSALTWIWLTRCFYNSTWCSHWLSQIWVKSETNVNQMWVKSESNLSQTTWQCQPFFDMKIQFSSITSNFEWTFDWMI